MCCDTNTPLCWQLQSKTSQCPQCRVQDQQVAQGITAAANRSGAPNGHKAWAQGGPLPCCGPRICCVRGGQTVAAMARITAACLVRPVCSIPQKHSPETTGCTASRERQATPLGLLSLLKNTCAVLAVQDCCAVASCLIQRQCWHLMI